jgi:hypothetical protein
MLTQITIPEGTDQPWPVDNVPGGNVGTIQASGTTAGSSKTPVFLKVVNGTTYTPGTIPIRPLTGCTKIYAGVDGGWAYPCLGGAKCSPCEPFPPNQLLVWVYSNSTYQASLCNFTGISTN